MSGEILPDMEKEEAETRRLVQAALDGPTRPLRSDQVDALVRAATAFRSPVPGWILLFLAAGPLALILLAALNAFQGSGMAELALVIPLVNLALSPFAALLLYIRLRNPESKRKVP